jgi:HK97 family phage major capsid protein
MPDPKLNEVASFLAEDLKKKIGDSKVETVKELKALVPSMITESLGEGTPGLKSLVEIITKDVMTRIPQGSIFDADKSKGYDPEIGLKSLNKKQADDMAESLLFSLLPLVARQEMPRFAGKNVKALSVATGSSGGYALPEEFVAEVARKLVHTSVFLGSCRVWSGVEMIGKMPRETGTVSVTIAGELVTPSNTQFALGQLTWALQKRMALTNLPQELWKFSGIDVLNLLATMFAEQFQKTEDNYYLNGSGSQQPMGLLTQTTGMNSLSISGSNIAWQDFQRAKHAIKSQYRLEKGNCAWMMNNNSILLASEIADDNNRPVFMDRGPYDQGIAGPNVPPQTVGFISGYPVLENPYVPGPVTEASTTPTTSKIIFSNFMRGYYAFKGQSMEVKTSDQAYDAFINDGLYTRAIDFFDGKPAIPEATAIMSGVK